MRRECGHTREACIPFIQQSAVVEQLQFNRTRRQAHARDPEREQHPTQSAAELFHGEGFAFGVACVEQVSLLYRYLLLLAGGSTKCTLFGSLKSGTDICKS